MLMIVGLQDEELAGILAGMINHKFDQRLSTEKLKDFVLKNNKWEEIYSEDPKKFSEMFKIVDKGKLISTNPYQLPHTFECMKENTKIEYLI